MDVLSRAAETRKAYFGSIAAEESVRYLRKVRQAAEAGAVPPGAVASWNSRRDFSGPQVFDAPLDPWQELAQVLLSANEFVFVD